MIAYILEIYFYLCIFLSEGSTIEFKEIRLREYIFRSKIQPSYSYHIYPSITKSPYLYSFYTEVKLLSL